MPHDLTLAIARAPYTALSDAARRHDARAFEARLFGRRTTVLTGAEAARVFYSDAMERAGSAPAFLGYSLFGKGGVQGLDGEAHRARKALHLDLMTRDTPAELASRVSDALDTLAEGRPDLVTVQDAAELILARVICDWAGVPVAPDEMRMRAAQLSNLFEHAAPIHPAFLKAVRARRQSDDWGASLIGAVREGRLEVPQDRALYRIATWRDHEGALMPPDVGAVELSNVLRPFVAISAFLTFLAHVMKTEPKAAGADPHDLVQETRRTAPFFPMLVARAARATEALGHPIPQGQRVLLDIYGTNRDASVWDAPDAFRPERFNGREVGPFELIPQGGGDHVSGHRCPGEWTTIAVMEAFVRWSRRVAWDVPDQDLTLDMRSLPALPRDRMRIARLRPQNP
ncbi:cytochrome P450 [Palleronia sediminis]|uniref:Cytochrome P450 n=1 Tax=Palleronia sediminis TaxID=2547833 RepID=A0A4R6ANM1_9RHOB|nr:cytochrome P450 [Palleronia sediminis]TDL83536.1 cytochrome P450 [Palleronia sediminis]